MPVYRIHRMKDAPRQQFRTAPHITGIANVKPKDYEAAGEIEAENEYAAWAALRSNALPLMVGDLLETASGELRICKYVGFDEARWILPELKSPDPRAPEAPNPAGFAPPARAGHPAQA